MSEVDSRNKKVTTHTYDEVIKVHKGNKKYDTKSFRVSMTYRFRSQNNTKPGSNVKMRLNQH